MMDTKGIWGLEQSSMISEKPSQSGSKQNYSVHDFYLHIQLENISKIFLCSVKFFRLFLKVKILL